MGAGKRGEDGACGGAGVEDLLATAKIVLVNVMIMSEHGVQLH